MTPFSHLPFSLLQGANANYAGVSGLMGPPGSAGAVTPVVQQKLQKMVQTNRCGFITGPGNLLVNLLLHARTDLCFPPCMRATVPSCRVCMLHHPRNWQHFHRVCEAEPYWMCRRLEAFYPPQALQRVFARLDCVNFKCAPFSPIATALQPLITALQCNGCSRCSAQPSVHTPHGGTAREVSYWLLTAQTTNQKPRAHTHHETHPCCA